MATLTDLRLKAHLSVARLAELAQVDRTTVTRAESGQPVQDVSAYKIAEALSQALKQKISYRDIDQLNIL